MLRLTNGDFLRMSPWMDCGKAWTSCLMLQIPGGYQTSFIFHPHSSPGCESQSLRGQNLRNYHSDFRGSFAYSA
jgi:hypothetical protein